MAKIAYNADSASLPAFLLLPELLPDLVGAMHPRAAEPGFAAATSGMCNVQLTA